MDYWWRCGAANPMVMVLSYSEDFGGGDSAGVEGVGLMGDETNVSFRGESINLNSKYLYS
jgi:hypothetical protein